MVPGVAEKQDFKPAAIGKTGIGHRSDEREQSRSGYTETGKQRAGDHGKGEWK
jgi:hypothetical protein